MREEFKLMNFFGPISHTPIPPPPSSIPIPIGGGHHVHGASSNASGVVTVKNGTITGMTVSSAGSGYPKSISGAPVAPPPIIPPVGFNLPEVQSIREIKQDVKRATDNLNKLYEIFGHLIKNGSTYYVMGGFFSSLWHGQNVHDYDIYLSTKHDSKIVTDFLESTYAAGLGNIQPGKTDSSNNYGPGHYYVTLPGLPPFNIVVFQSGTPEQIFSTYDFEHCKVYYDVLADSLFIKATQLNLIENRLLFTKQKTPLKAKRVLKYMSRGWKVHPQQIAFDVVKKDGTHFKIAHNTAYEQAHEWLKEE